VSLKYTDGREMVLVLVGKHDSGLKPGWISAESPVGQAILGKKKGESAELNGQKIAVLAIDTTDLE
jgi:transcription elongation GreA/GreB family factor